MPAAGTQFDGSYTGQDTLLSGGGFQCGDPTLPVRSTVAAASSTYPFTVSPAADAPLPVQIAADGTLGGQMQYGTGEDRPASSFAVWVTLQDESWTTLDATAHDALRPATADRDSADTALTCVSPSRRMAR